MLKFNNTYKVTCYSEKGGDVLWCEEKKNMVFNLAAGHFLGVLFYEYPQMQEFRVFLLSYDGTPYNDPIGPDWSYPHFGYADSSGDLGQIPIPFEFTGYDEYGELFWEPDAPTTTPVITDTISMTIGASRVGYDIYGVGLICERTTSIPPVSYSAGTMPYRVLFSCAGFDVPRTLFWQNIVEITYTIQLENYS